MITILFINFIILVVGSIFVFLPEVSIATLPYAGQAISDTLYSAVYTWNAFLVTFPYAVVVWNMFLFVVIPLEIGLIIAKFFLGHRTPNSAH